MKLLEALLKSNKITNKVSGSHFRVRAITLELEDGFSLNYNYNGISDDEWFITETNHVAIFRKQDGDYFVINGFCDERDAEIYAQYMKFQFIKFMTQDSIVLPQNTRFREVEV